jgi:putative transposase
MERHKPVIAALNGMTVEIPRLGFWKYREILTWQGNAWNHKRIYRVYYALGLNQLWRTKRSLQGRDLR